MMRRIGATAVLFLAWVWGSPGRAAEPPVTALAFTPSGDALVYGSQAGLSVRSAGDPADAALVETTLEQIHDLRFSSAGDRLAVAGGVPADEGLLEILDWPSRQQRLRLVIGEDLLYAVVWLDEGATAAVAGFDGTARLVDVETGTIDGSLKGHSRGVTSITDVGITASSDPDFQLVTGSIDQTLRVWRPSTGETIRTLHNHTKPVHALALRPAQEGLPVVASISDDRTVRFWQPTIGRMMRFAHLDSDPLCLAWTPGGEHVVVGCADGHVRMVDPDTAGLIAEREALSGRITSLAVDRATGRIAAGGPDGVVEVLPPLESTSSDAGM